MIFFFSLVSLPFLDRFFDAGMKMVWNRRAEFQVIESVQYYFNKIDVIKMPDYLPDKVKEGLCFLTRS